jgi:hypothetical protein
MVAQSHSTTCPSSLSSQHNLIPMQRASFILAFLAHLLWTAPLPDGKEQFNRVTDNHREETWLSRQLAIPVLMGLQEQLQPPSLRQSSKQGIIVALEPAIEGPKCPPFRENQMPIVTSSLG